MKTFDDVAGPDFDDHDSRPDPFVVAVTAVVALGLWIRPLVTSLWLDELGTWWVVKDGLQDAIDRAIEFHGQSPAYYVTAWASTTLFGKSELALRLPSLIAMAVATVLVYRLVLRLFDRETARLALFTFVASGPIAFAASDARPYACAIAALLAATVALVRWLDEGADRWGVAFVLLAGLAIWFHYLVALGFIAHAVYAAVRIRAGESRVSWGRLALAAAGLLVLVLPLAAQFASLWGRRGSLTTPDDPSPPDLFLALVAPVGPVALLLGALLARVTGAISLSRVPARHHTLAVLAPWLIVPPAFLFFLSVGTPLKLMSARYYLSAAPAAAIFLAWAIRAIEPSTARRIVAGVLAICSVAAYGESLKYGEDWASAASFVRSSAGPDTPVFIHPAFVESSQIDWLRDPVRRSYLTSPVAFYPMAGDLRLVPYLVEEDGIEYMEDELLEATTTDRFLLVTRYPQVPWATWMIGVLGDEGWDAEVVALAGLIQIWEFTRDGGAPV